MTNVKLEDLPDLVLAATTYLYGENTPYSALADAGKIPLSLIDARNAALYLALAGGTMTGDIDMGSQDIDNVGHILFDLAHSGTTEPGHLHWNNADGTIEIGLLGGEVILQIGQEVNAYVVQKTGSTIPNGKAVIVTGISGERLEVSLTDLTDPLRSATTGLTTESIDNNQQGYVTTFGLVRDLDTSMWAEGAFIWSDGVTPGELTDTRPDPPLRGVFIGYVVRSHATEGSIWVFPFNISRLQFLSDVYAPSLTDKDVLRWVSSNSRWENSAVLPNVKSETVTTQGLGSSPDVYAFGFYEFSVSDVTLTNVSPTQAFGSANVAHASHAFAVFGGAGTVNTGVVGLRVNGISITDASGSRSPADTEILSSDITTLSLDDYLETEKKWLGTVTFELFTVSGTPTVYSLDFNYGITKYNDWFNNDFELVSVEAVGLGGATDVSVDVILIHHELGDWTYSSGAFTPINAGHTIASMSNDHATDDQTIKSEHISWKRTDLSQFVSGSTNEGFLVLVTTSANNTIEYLNIHVGVSI